MSYRTIGAYNKNDKAMKKIKKQYKEREITKQEALGALGLLKYNTQIAEQLVGRWEDENNMC